MTPFPPNTHSFDDLTRAIYAFEALLVDMGLHVPPGSPLEDAALGIEELRSIHCGHMAHNHQKDHRPRWRRALSIADLAQRLLEVRTHSDFPKLTGHLALLIRDKDVTQYDTTPHGNSENDKVFELWAAAALLRTMTDCAIDDPNNSKGDNPDFIGTWRRKRWGFAFKAPHSENPEAHIKNIRKGVEQINVSEAEAGMVLLNGKNFFPHDAAWPAAQTEAGEFIYSAPDFDTVTRMMRSAANHCNGMICFHAAGGDIHDPVEPTAEDLARGRKVFWDSLGHKKPEQFVLTLWPMVVGTTVPGTNIQALSTIKQVTGFEGDAVSSEAKELALAFNLSLHGRDPFGPEPPAGG